MLTSFVRLVDKICVIRAIRGKQFLLAFTSSLRQKLHNNTAGSLSEVLLFYYVIHVSHIAQLKKLKGTKATFIFSKVNNPTGVRLITLLCVLITLSITRKLLGDSISFFILTGNCPMPKNNLFQPKSVISVMMITTLVFEQMSLRFEGAMGFHCNRKTERQMTKRTISLSQMSRAKRA